MEIDKIHKYLSLNKQMNGSTEVLFAGQPCLVVSEMAGSNWWRINPVFAKLVYGANVFSDIPSCSQAMPTSEEAIADGLKKLYELGAFTKEYDYPEDTYAATLHAVTEEVKEHVLSKTKNIIEAVNIFTSIMDTVMDGTFDIMEKDERSEFLANLAMANKPKSSVSKKVKIKNASGETLSTHDSESDALKHYKGMDSNKGCKIVREEIDGDVDIVIEGEMDMDDHDEKYTKWTQGVKDAHPDKALKFKARVENGMNTTSAEVKGVDRSFGTFDHDTAMGTVFNPDKEKVEDDGIQSALKKNKPFTPKA
jgi:hypothetical protein